MRRFSYRLCAAASKVLAMFDPWLALWGLTPDGDPILNRGAHLLPVRRGDERAMLKVALEKEDAEGAVLMTWWNGIGAAPVLAHRNEALLLARATGSRSLEAYARDGRDDEASRIICAVASRLHAPRPIPLPDLMPLERLFGELFPLARSNGGILARSAGTARFLLPALGLSLGRSTIETRCVAFRPLARTWLHPCVSGTLTTSPSRSSVTLIWQDSRLSGRTS